MNVRNTIKKIVASLTLLALVFVTQFGTVLAADCVITADNPYAVCAAPLPNPAASSAKIQDLLSIVFGVIGALSLLMLTIGGFRYITANGDAQAIAKAKNTIIYALVGLVVAILATVIVTFVTGRISS